MEKSESSEDDWESPLTVPDTFGKRIYWVAMLPMTLLVYFTVPDCRRSGIWHRLYFLTLILSVVWIAGLSYVLVWMVVATGECSSYLAKRQLCAAIESPCWRQSGTLVAFIASCEIWLSHNPTHSVNQLSVGSHNPHTQPDIVGLPISQSKQIETVIAAKRGSLGHMTSVHISI